MVCAASTVSAVINALYPLAAAATVETTNSSATSDSRTRSRSIIPVATPIIISATATYPISMTPRSQQTAVSGAQQFGRATAPVMGAKVDTQVTEEAHVPNLGSDSPI